MALVEGGGGAVTDSKSPGKAPRGGPAAPSPGVTKLQKYVAPADDFTAASALLGARTVASPQAEGERVFDAPGTEYNPVDLYSENTEVSTGEKEEPVERKALQIDDVESKSKTYRARKAKEMSWDDYLGLSDRARAAVDFNTMIIQAREKDLSTDYDTTDPAQEERRKTYDKAVERMFGEDGGSITFAPETVALLNDIGFERTDAKRFDDLDDFLGLKSALTVRDLDKLGSIKIDPVVEGVETVSSAARQVAGTVEIGSSGSDAMTALAAGTDSLRESLTRGNQLLQNWQDVAAAARNESLGFLGGTPNEIVDPAITLSPAARSLMYEDRTYFDHAFQTLSNAPEEDKGEVLKLIRGDLKPKGLFEEFVRYIDTKSAFGQDSRVVPGGDMTIRDRTPKEFRELLGLKTKGEDDATD